MAIRITLYVPEALPDGTPVDQTDFDTYEDALLDIALKARVASGGANEEGFTLTPGVLGVWRSPSGQVYREPMRLYCLDVADSAEVVDDVHRLSERVQSELRQEAVYVTLTPIEPFVASLLSPA